MTFRGRTREETSLHQSVMNALAKWVERHPAPDAPALSIAQTGQFSPRQLLKEVAEQSETGQLVEEMIDHAAAFDHPEGLEGVLRMFEREGPSQEEESQSYEDSGGEGR